MSEHGILMSGPMVKAYLAGRKTQTRRTRGLALINEHPDEWRCDGLSVNQEVFVFTNIVKPAMPQIRIKPPYGYAGNQLYLKETYAVICREAIPVCSCETEEEIAQNHYVEYRADTGNQYPGDWPEEEAKGNDEAPKWKSSMFMPRKYARIVTLVVNVRVERLQQISEGDAIAEGIDRFGIDHDVTLVKNHLVSGSLAIDRYARLWNSLNEKRGMGWDKNPWVWVYEFESQTSGKVAG